MKRTTVGNPSARRLDLAENLHGHLVRDPYRWLEDPASGEGQAWLAAQDALMREQAAALPGRLPLAARIRELMGAGYVSAPVWRGQRQFFLRRAADQEHSVLMTVAPGEPERALIDPIALDPSGATTLDHWAPDNEGRLLAYQLSAGGDEESMLRVTDILSGELAEGPIDRCRYSPIAWLPGGKAFYYVRRLPPAVLPPGEEQYHRRVYLHTVGTPADEDILLFGAGRDKTNYYGASVSRDGRWLAISAAQGTAPRSDLWLADLAASPITAPTLTVVQEGVDARTGVHIGRDGLLYVFTDDGAPRGRLAVTDPGQPDRASPAADDLVRVRRVRHQSRPGLRRIDPRLGGNRGCLRRRGAARRRGGGRGMAPRRNARPQAERVRRLPRGGGDAHLRGVDDTRPTRHIGRIERRVAGRRGHHPAAGALRRGHLLRPAARHGALRAFRARPDLERRVRHRRRPPRAGLAALLLAVSPRARGDALPGGPVHDL